MNNLDLKEAYRPLASGKVQVSDFLKNFALSVVAASDNEMEFIAEAASRIAENIGIKTTFDVRIESPEEQALADVGVTLEEREGEFVIRDSRGAQPMFYGNETNRSYVPKIADPFSRKDRAVKRALEIFGGRIALNKPKTPEVAQQQLQKPAEEKPTAQAPEPKPAPALSTPTLPPPPPEVTGQPAPAKQLTAKEKAEQRKAEKEAKAKADAEKKG